MGDLYYLGANSGGGFRSLYRYFAAGPGDRLHVIKGGPGTGKSSFMRRIGREFSDSSPESVTVRRKNAA